MKKKLPKPVKKARHRIIKAKVHAKKPKPHIVIGELKPVHVAEPVVVAVVPKTIWERFTDWLGSL